jgi:hypothetical protein
MPTLHRRLLAELEAGRSLLEERRHSNAAVHKARQHTKKARAILRLLRPSIGEARYQRDNIDLRDTNRLLCAARDTVVISQTLAAIGRRKPALLPAAMDLQQSWNRQRASDRKLRVGSNATRSARLRLERASARVRRNAGAREDPEALTAALRAQYRKARKAFRAALRARSDRAWHECRKQTKYLGFALKLMHHKPARLARAARQAHLLAALLGEDHDLALIAALVRSSGAEGSRRGAPLLAHLVRRRSRLQKRAAEVGAHAYRDKPDAFMAS